MLDFVWRQWGYVFFGAWLLLRTFLFLEVENESEKNFGVFSGNGDGGGYDPHDCRGGELCVILYGV